MTLNSSEVEKKNDILSEQQSDNFDTKQKEQIEEQNKIEQEAQDNKEQKDKKTTEAQADTEKLLASLDSEVVKDVYSEKTKKEMLALRNDIAAWTIAEKDATKKLDTLKKEQKEKADKDQKNDKSDDEKLTLWQQAKKWTLLSILPAWLGKKLADKILPKEDKEEKESNESKRWWKALKRTWMISAWTFIASKIRWFLTKQLDKKQEQAAQEKDAVEQEANQDTVSENKQDDNPEAQNNTGEQPVVVADHQNDVVDQQTEPAESVAETWAQNNVTPELLEKQYQILSREHPTFGESFLRAWASAILLKQDNFQDNGKIYFCYKNDKWLNAVMADITKYQAHIEKLEQQSDEDLPILTEQLTPEQQQQSDEATEEADQLRKGWFDELYILTRMYQRWFIPAKAFWGGRMLFLPNALFDKQFDAVVWMRKRIPAIRGRLTVQQALDLGNMTDLDYMKRVDLLANMEADIKAGKSFKDIERTYGKQMETEMRWRQKRWSKATEKVQQNIDATIDRYVKNEKDILELEKQMKETKEASLKKMQEIDAQAKTTKDTKARKVLLDELQKYTDDYNDKAIDYQKMTGQKMSTMSQADILRLEARSPMVKWILKSSWGASKFVENVNRKWWKAMLWVAVWWLATKGVADIHDQWFISKETGLDVADLWFGMVPVLGWWYDVRMAIRGKDLNWREMSTTDRRIRWGVWGVSAVLDAVSFGIAGTALRTVIKWGRATIKVLDTAIDAEKATKAAAWAMKAYRWLRMTQQVAMFWWLGYGLYEWTKDFAVNLVKPTAQWITNQVEVATTKPVTI